MDFCRKYLKEIVLSAGIKENAQEIIKKLKEDNNYIYIITSRKKPYFDEPFSMTEKFLKDNNILYDELIVGCEDKYSFCKKNKIDIMIDDEPQNINSISKIIPVLVFKGIQNEKCHGNNIIKVDTWNEVYDFVDSL